MVRSWLSDRFEQLEDDVGPQLDVNRSHGVVARPSRQVIRRTLAVVIRRRRGVPPIGANGTSRLRSGTRGTDREPLAIALALENAERNGVVGLTTSLLEWSQAITTSTPMLLASDLVYEPSSPDALYSLAHTSGLLAPSGVLVMAGPTARAQLANTLVGRFRDVGYAHTLEALQVEWDGHEDTVELHTLRRPA